ncbi:MAG: cysteate synthase [Candidatus Poseidoniaceae archaeon]
MLNYTLKCLKTNDEFEDDYTLHYTDDALIQAEYKKEFEPLNKKGVWRYFDWLPTEETSSQVAGTITYHAEELGERLGLSNLWVAFHGYWPEKDALCPTGSFKDMEAVPTIQRMKDHSCKGMICASAGNTARAFTHFCAEDNFPLIVIVADIHAHRIWVQKGMEMDSVKVVVVKDGTYQDAKDVAKTLSKKLTGWQLEGGAHNIARRDGIGSLILNSYEKIGKLPDHYFQAVGGGPGPIGVYEMMERLIDSGHYDGDVAKLHLSQNPEHCPIHNAWQRGSRKLKPEDFPEEDVEVYSDYLLSETPAYSVVGGVYDVLEATDGETYAIEEDDAIKAGKILEEIEEIDVLSPAKVALASLIQAKEEGKVNQDDCILLNISGGGIERLKREKETKIVTPWVIDTKKNLVDKILNSLN